jgi:hypothetical protein
MMDSNFDSTNIGGHKEFNRNVSIVKTDMSNDRPSGTSEFEGKRVPMDGIEQLIGQEKVPESLGKRMDRKNMNQTNKHDDVSDIDEIISEAESINRRDKFSASEERHQERRRRRVIKKKRDGNPFMPSSKTDRQRSDSDEVRNEPNDDVSDYETSGSHHQQDLESEDGSTQVSGETEESSVRHSPPETKWRPASMMTKDEITSEKMDLLYRYGRLESNGYKSGLALNMRTPLETLRSEISKLERMRNVQRSIRTQRKLLISFASGTEYVNKRYNPYKFALDGWSGEVLENIGDYDEVFEELHDKYKDSLQMAPELKLLTMVGGSGLMFHLSNTLFKSSTPQLNDILQRNPDIMAQIQKEALNSMSATNAGDPMFQMMMNGVREKKRQQAQQQPWTGRPGYAPPRTTIPNPQPSNFNVDANVSQVPQGQGIVPNQPTMSGPQGFDDILNELNSSNNGLINEEVPEQKEVRTKPVRKRRTAKKNNEVIDLDM